MVISVEEEIAIPRLMPHPRTGGLEWAEQMGWHRFWSLWEFGDGAVVRDLPLNPDFEGFAGELERTLEGVMTGVMVYPSPPLEGRFFDPDVATFDVF